MMFNKSNALKNKSAQTLLKKEAQDNIYNKKIMNVSNDGYVVRKNKLLAKEQFCCDRATD